VADLSTAEGADKAIAFTRAIRPLDILVNNMGIFESKEFTKVYPSPRDSVWIQLH
jgi:short-subunit dehydrogenase